MKFKLIGRILKAVGKGVIKILPFANFRQELKDLKIRDAAEKIRGMNISSADLDNRFYYLLDIIDDGKANDSFDKQLIDKVIELIVNLAGGTAAIIWIIQNL